MSFFVGVWGVQSMNIKMALHQRKASTSLNSIFGGENMVPWRRLFFNRDYLGLFVKALILIIIKNYRVL